MKLKDVNFNEIQKNYSPYKEISIGKLGEWHTGFIEEVLSTLPDDYMEREVKDIRNFFGSCVIELM